MSNNQNERKIQIARAYISLGKKLKRAPTVVELNKIGVSKRSYEYYFGNKDEMIAFIKKYLPNEFDPIITQSNDSNNIEAKKDYIKKYVKLALRLKRLPSYSDMASNGMKRSTTQYYFGDKGKLLKFIEENCKEEYKVIKDLIDFKGQKEVSSHKVKLAFAKQYLKIGFKLKRIPTHTELFNENLNRSTLRYHFGDKDGVEKFIEKHFPKELNKLVQLSKSVEQKEISNELKILRRYVSLSAKNGIHPSYSDMERVGVSKELIRKHFENLNGLQEAAELNFPEVMELVFDEDALLNEDRILLTEKTLRESDRIVVSSIGTGACDKKYLDSIFKYQELNSIAGTKTSIALLCTQMDFSHIDPYIKGLYMDGKVHIIFRDFQYHKYLHLNAVMIEEKVVNPSAGLSRYHVHDSSFIFASPKQTLVPVPTKAGKFPRFKMSPGAITKPDYYKNMTVLKNNLKFKKTKRRMMADNDHLIGAIVVERDGASFHFRQTQRQKDGGFWDFFISYNKDGAKVDIPAGMVWGDIHSKTKNKYNFDLNLRFLKLLGIKKNVVHDIYDSASQNPHEKDAPISSMVSWLEGEESTPDEIKELVNDINNIRAACPETFIVDSNHDDMFKRSFNNKMIWRGSQQNAFLATLLHPMAVLHELRDDYTEDQVKEMIANGLGVDVAFLEKTYPHLFKKIYLLQFACNLYGLKNGPDVIWGNLESSYKISDFECGDHGHKGANGAKGGPGAFLNSFEKVISGHTHTERQHNFVATVGHTVDRQKQRYAKGGMSSWTISRIFISNDGQLQSIRTINGRFKRFQGSYVPEELKFAFKKLEQIQNSYQSDSVGLQGVA